MIINNLESNTEHCDWQVHWFRVENYLFNQKLNRILGH